LLIWNSWFAGIVDTSIFGQPKHQFGIARLNPHAETWITLLQLLGVEGIIRSRHILEHPINLEELPSGLVSPCAIELNLAVLLAGLAGCTKITVEANANEPLIASCENATLKFSSAGPMSMIGKYHQNMNSPTYHMYTRSRVQAASGVGYKSMLYTNRPCPTDEYLATVQDTKILDDLGRKCSPCNHSSHPSKKNITSA
jgi:hypothetical protein